MERMERLLRPVTAEELFRMSHDGVRRELVRGEGREMPPAGAEHGGTTSKLHIHLGYYVYQKQLGGAICR